MACPIQAVDMKRGVDSCIHLSDTHLSQHAFLRVSALDFLVYRPLKKGKASGYLIDRFYHVSSGKNVIRVSFFLKLRKKQ